MEPTEATINDGATSVANAQAFPVIDEIKNNATVINVTVKPMELINGIMITVTADITAEMLMIICFAFIGVNLPDSAIFLET